MLDWCTDSIKYSCVCNYRYSFVLINEGHKHFWHTLFQLNLFFTLFYVYMPLWNVLNKATVSKQSHVSDILSCQDLSICSSVCLCYLSPPSVPCQFSQSVWLTESTPIHLVVICSSPTQYVYPALTSSPCWLPHSTHGLYVSHSSRV